jgi:hypothetical protein
MYTDTVKELAGYPVQNSPSGSFLFRGGSVGRGGLVYDIVRRGMPQKDTLDNLRTPVCFRILSTSFTSVSIFSVWCYSSVSISMVVSLVTIIPPTPCVITEPGRVKKELSWQESICTTVTIYLKQLITYMWV